MLIHWMNFPTFDAQPVAVAQLRKMLSLFSLTFTLFSLSGIQTDN